MRGILGRKMVVLLTLATVFLGSLAPGAGAHLTVDEVSNQLPSDGGTGAFYLTKSDTSTPYNKVSGNISLNEVRLSLPELKNSSGYYRPVPYFFLGAYDSANYNAEGGIFYNKSTGKWRAFVLRADGYWWDAGSRTDMQPATTDSIQVIFEVPSDGWIRLWIRNYTTGVNAYQDIWVGGSFRQDGSGMRMYRAVSLAFDPGAEDFVNVNAAFHGAHWRDVYLYGPSGYWAWTSARTSSIGVYEGGDSRVVRVDRIYDYYNDVVDISYGTCRSQQCD